MEPVKVAIIYYSATGTVHALARAAAEGAEKAYIGATGALWYRRDSPTRCTRLSPPPAPPTADRSPPCWPWRIRSTARAASSCPRDTPTPSSSSQAIPTAPLTWPAMARPATWPWKQHAYRTAIEHDSRYAPPEPTRTLHSMDHVDDRQIDLEAEP